MNDQQYQTYIKKISPNSPIARNLCFAFVIGGLICTLGQVIMNGFQALGLDETDAGTLTSVSLVFLSALLTGLSLYDDIAKFAGAGTLVPITGFANSIAAPAIEFKTEGFITGVAAKMFTIAGPVLVYGTVASIVYGIIYYLATL